MIPSSMTYKANIVDKPFLVVDARYLQSQGKTVAWGSVTNIKVKRERLNAKGERYNYRLTISYMSDRELTLDTCYFKEQDEIVEMFRSVALNKHISWEEVVLNPKKENKSDNLIDYKL